MFSKSESAQKTEVLKKLTPYLSVCKVTQYLIPYCLNYNIENAPVYDIILIHEILNILKEKTLNDIFNKGKNQQEWLHFGDILDKYHE